MYTINRATEPQSHRATEPQSHRATEPQSHRATESYLTAFIVTIVFITIPEELNTS